MRGFGSTCVQILVCCSVVTEFMIKNLGLEICADTIIGNAMTRGVSGGQKKRVTTGARGPSRLFWLPRAACMLH